MLWRSSHIIGYALRATDGSIGSVADLLFDDTHWKVRWAVIDTGSWLPGRKVILPSASLGRPDAAVREVPVEVDRKTVENSPGIDTDAPVSRQHEAQVFDYYGWTPYWVGGYAPTLGALPAGVQPSPPPEKRPPAEPPGSAGDPHLRSVEEVTGYTIEASDGSIGHVEEMLVDDERWAVRYVVVDTGNWLPGRRVLVSPEWFDRVDWSEQRVHARLNQEQVKESPEYDPSTAVDRAYEDQLFKYYGMPPYWW